MILTTICFLWMGVEVLIKYNYLEPDVIPVHKKGSKHKLEIKEQWQVPLLMPFFPQFFDFFSQCTGIYEGIPLIPPLYSNSRNHKYFDYNMKIVTALVAIYAILIAPISVVTYGPTLREVVLLNLEFGVFQ